MALPPSNHAHPPPPNQAARSLGGAIDRPAEVVQGRLGVNEQLWPRTGTEPLRFTFQDRGRIFLGRLVRVGERARLHLASEIARIPYTVESPAARAKLIATMRGTLKPSLGRLVVGPRQTVCVEGELAFDAPVTPNRLIAAAALFVVATRHAIDRIASAETPAPAPSKRR